MAQLLRAFDVIPRHPSSDPGVHTRQLITCKSMFRRSDALQVPSGTHTHSHTHTRQIHHTYTQIKLISLLKVV